jgi:hypothetical protein
MKSSIIVLLLLLFIQNSIAQILLSKEVEELYKAADTLLHYNINLANAAIKVSEEQSVALTRKYYEVINHDPEGLESSAAIKYNKWRADRVKNPEAVKPGYKLALLKQIISNQFGDDFSNVITTAYFLRVKILQKDVTEHKEKDVDMVIKHTNLTAFVEDKLKGSQNMNPGDTLEFFYPHTWFNKDLFTVGESYLVPLRLIDCAENNCKYVVRVFKENHFSWIIYIRDEKLISLNNQTVNWKIFKAEFVNKFLSF